MINWYGEKQSDGFKVLYKIKRDIATIKSPYQKIRILETYDHGKLFTLDDLVMLTEKEEFTYHEMLVHVPLFFCKNPKRVLIIGGGDGGTARECLKHPNVKIDLCELDKEVIMASKKYLPFVGKYLDNKRVTVYTEDGFKFLKDPKRKSLYDVILVDGTDPIGEGAKLFEKQFFALTKNCLVENGIYCTQCETPFTHHGKIIGAVNKRLKSVFNNVKHYGAAIPMYPSGYWTFVMASDGNMHFQKKRYLELETKLKCKYYNDEIHAGCFMLPNFFKQIIGQE